MGIRYIWLVLLISAVASCKSSKVPQQPTQASEVETDTVAVVVSDTLTIAEQKPATQDSVVIQVHRLLKDTLSIIGVGDIMMGTNYPDPSYLPANKGRDMLTEVAPILQNADVTFGNLEGVILNDGGDAKYCKNPKVCYIFRSPEYMVQNLVDAGFDVMSTANNHAGDFGNPGRENTMRVLDSLGLEHAGLMTHPYTLFMKDGMKYGFAAFSPNTGTMSIHDIASAQKIVAYLDSISDVVIISFHGGAEGSKYQHVTRQNEFFYGENRGNVYNFAHKMIDAGADIIFGHGPHVTRALDLYKDRFIIYSLGNFCTYGRFNLRGDNGIAPIINVFTDPEGKFLYGQITPIIQVGGGIPKIDSQGRAINKLRELTEKDFPEVPLKIDDTGRIFYLQN